MLSVVEDYYAAILIGRVTGFARLSRTSY